MIDIDEYGLPRRTLASPQQRSDTSSRRLDPGSPARRKGSGYRKNGVDHLRFSVNDGAMITIFFKINKISRLFAEKNSTVPLFRPLYRKTST